MPIRPPPVTRAGPPIVCPGVTAALLTPPVATDRRRSALAALAAGLLLGATIGIAARAWMRLVSGDPEFTWSGTSFIVVAYTFAGLTQGLALAARRRGVRWWFQLPVRLVAAFGGLLLGFGAGIVMLPALVGGSLAVARTDWARPARVIAAGVAALNALGMWWLLADGLPVWRLTVGWLAMLPLYAAIIGGLALNLRPLAGGPRLGRRSLAGVAAGAVALVVVLFALAMRGV